MQGLEKPVCMLELPTTTVFSEPCTLRYKKQSNFWHTWGKLTTLYHTTGAKNNLALSECTEGSDPGAGRRLRSPDILGGPSTDASRSKFEVLDWRLRTRHRQRQMMWVHYVRVDRLIMCVSSPTRFSSVEVCSISGCCVLERHFDPLQSLEAVKSALREQADTRHGAAC